MLVYLVVCLFACLFVFLFVCVLACLFLCVVMRCIVFSWFNVVWFLFVSSVLLYFVLL